MVAGTVLPYILAKVRVKFHVFGCSLLYLQQEEETDTKQQTETLHFCPY